MPDIILKGRDTSGNLVDNVYEGVNIISVKNSADEDIKFYGTPFSYMNIYIMGLVEIPGENNNKITPIANFAKIQGPFGAYGVVYGDQFEEYKQDGSFGGQLILCFTMKTLTIGELYDMGDIIN